MIKLNQLFAILFMALSMTVMSCNNTEQSTTTVEEVETQSSQYGGLALYTLRDTLAQNPKDVLKEVAAVGYQYIESAGYADGKFYGMEPTEFKSYLAEVGLIPMSSHNSEMTLDNADQTIADVKAAGFKYIVIPVPPMGHFKFDPETFTLSMSEEVEEVTSIINTIGEKASAAGLECLYHNHDFEFLANSNGIVPMDYFIENTNPEHVNFQLDLYWAVRAGADPIAYFNKAPGRFKSWHIKDMDDQGRFAPVGTGQIDFVKILAEKELAGMECYFVEQDMTFDGQKPMEAIVISREGLEKFGFE